MIPYILNAGLILVACLAFYKLLLQKETFYRLNRYLLLCCLVVAFSLPLLRMPQQLSFRKTEVLAVNTTVANNNNQDPLTINANKGAATQPVVNNQTTATTPVITWHKVLQWLFWLYWFGVIVFAFNFLLQTVVLFYRAFSNPVIKDGPYRIVEVKGDKAPCSFLNNIFINPEKYDWDSI